MSNKRNRRRGGQRVRAEVNRKPRKITHSMSAFIAAQPARRKLKAADDFVAQFVNPTKKRRKAQSRARIGERKIRRRLTRTRKNARKPRKNYGHTFWNHSHDV